METLTRFGTFSTVFKAIDLLHKKLETDINRYPFEKCGVDIQQQEIVHVALKRVYQTSSAKRVHAELDFLYRLRQSPCVIPVINFERSEANTIIVLPYFEHCDFRVRLFLGGLTRTRSFWPFRKSWTS
jgi:cell division control protein 7